MERHIFISYSREDDIIVGRLRRDLQQAGFNIWIDTKNIEPGTPDWLAAIQNAIANASCMIVALSKTAIKSEWVIKEIELALNPMMGQNRGPLNIFPVIVAGRGEVEKFIIPALERYQLQDARDSKYQSAVKTLIGSIYKSLGAKHISTTRWKAATVVLLIIVMVLIVSAIVIGSRPRSWSTEDGLSAFIPANSVRQDLNDFAWKSVEPGQLSTPQLAQDTIGQVNGPHIKFPVMLSSKLSEDPYYSIPQQIARLERRLREAEQGDWETLVATIFIASTDNTQIIVTPYLTSSDLGFVSLGFGQTVQTNQWATVVWRQVVDSTDYKKESIKKLEALKSEFTDRSLGLPRLIQIFSSSKPNATIGFSFTLKSDQPTGKEDIFNGTVYLGSVIFLP